MCISPNKLANGTLVSCHLCWQCIKARVNDWAGRCIAESKSVVETHAITLTYGRDLTVGEVDHERAAFLTYSDVQKFFKRLRRDGYKLRYFVTGEYGSLKGRAHWHIIIFWLDKVPPDLVMDKRFMWEYWPDGVAHFTRATYEGIRYNCKYINKDIGVAERQGHLSMSKKPPLGAHYFQRLARTYVEQGLSPQGTGAHTIPDGVDPEEYEGPGAFLYTFPEVKKKDGTPVEFRLADTSLDLFLDAFVNAWRAKHGNNKWSASRLVNEFYWGTETRDEKEDAGRFNLRIARLEKMAEDSEMRQRLLERLVGEKQEFNSLRMKWSEEHQTYIYNTVTNKFRHACVLIWQSGKWRMKIG